MESERISAESVRALLADALPLKGARVDCVSLDDEWVAVPIIEVDCAQRPDVADLPRVHGAEGDGEVAVEWLFLLGEGGKGVAVLTLRLQRPVRCHLKLAIDLDARAYLAAIVEAGGVALEMVTGTVYLTVPTRSLREILLEGSPAA